jgi:hypothetical protein
VLNTFKHRNVGSDSVISMHIGVGDGGRRRRRRRRRTRR